MATEYRNNAKVNVVTRRYGVSTSPTPPSPPRFAAEIGVCHRAHPRSAAAL